MAVKITLRILFLLFIVSVFSFSLPRKAEKKLTIIYDIGITDTVVFDCHGMDSIVKTNNLQSLSKQFSSSFSDIYTSISFSEQIPKQDTALLFTVYSPTIIKTKTQLVGRLWFLCKIIKDGKKVAEINKQVGLKIEAPNPTKDDAIKLINRCDRGMIAILKKEMVKLEK
jgi:hypothetical protein